MISNILLFIGGKIKLLSFKMTLVTFNITSFDK